MLEQAFAKLSDNTGLILHSDQGWQYQHKHYQKMLKNKGYGRVCQGRETVWTTPVQRIFSAY